jgi:YidC/Oxa1 family membrane protein insertase
MFDPFFEIISQVLNFFYELVPNYAVAIAMLTLVVMLVTTPLTLKSTRSMIEMQRHQPEIRKIQAQFKDDRQKLNEELMRFYKEHEINPLGSCLPLLIQMPVFIVLYRVVWGLTFKERFVGVQRALENVAPNITVHAGFRPKYLDKKTELYQALHGSDHMKSFGIDLSRSLLKTLSSDGFVTALPYVAVVAVIAVLSWYQQRQIMGRNAGQEVTPQQRMMMRLGPAMYTFFAVYVPLAVGVYFLVSTLYRVGQQAYITRSLYGHEDAIGVQAQKAMAEMRQQKAKESGGGGFLGGLLGGGASTTNGGRAGGSGGKAAASRKATAGGKAAGGKAQAGKAPAKGATRSATKSGGGAGGAGRTPRSSQNGRSGRSGARAGGGSVPASRPHPRSRKKKKRK